MKRLLVAIMLLTVGFSPAFAEVTSLETDSDKISYALGMNLGNMLRSLDFNIDQEKLLAGLAATFSQKRALMSESEMGLVLADLNRQMQERAMEEQAAIAEENLKRGQDFLEANGKVEGVTTLESGLQYKYLNKGEGASPTAEDTVKVHYRGMLVDGTEFDSSYKSGAPVELTVGGVISGWTEILQLMKEGDKMQVTIPSELAYGETGAPPVISPNSVLLFEMELVEVVKK